MPTDRQLAAVMFTDIVGFTFLMGKDESYGLTVLENNRRLHRVCVTEHGGRLVKEIGDGMLSCFSTAKEAVDCAIAMQMQMEGRDFRLRIGIHFGEVVMQEGDVYGNTVNIASRIEGLANPGAIFVSEEVVESVPDIQERQFVFLGEQSLKNVEPKMRIFGLEHPRITRPVLRAFLEDSIEEDIQQYHLLEKLAAGGMGIIYKALDIKLQRPIALKFLSPQVNRDEQARERFLREARSAAALQHPNICTIYEIDETEEGRYFIAMELVEGQNLQEYLREKGPLSLEETLDLALQLAEGLQHAHEAGIVHRDIKPVNIKITPDGTVKILDFGLALSGSLKSFKRGARVGTLPYMSPEQTRGEEVDHRSDLWSFGIVLYEMLAGRHPFGSEYDHTLVHAILQEPPVPFPTNRRPLPASLVRLIGACLEKERSMRIQTANDLTAALRRLRRDLNDPAGEKVVTVQPHRSVARKSWLLILLLPLFLIMGWLLSKLGKEASVGTLVATDTMEMTLFTGMGNLSLFPDWSPDGEWVVYVSDREGSMDIWKKQLAGGQAVRMTAAPGNEIEPAWSPDGRNIAFRGDLKGGGIFITPANGGTPYQLTTFGGSPDWSPNSRRLVFSAYGNIYLVAASGGEPQLLIEGTSANPHPIWTMDGKRILFWNRTLGDIHVVEAEEGASRALQLVPSGQEVGSLSLNQAGDQLLFTMGVFGGNKDIYEVGIDTITSLPTTRPRRLTVTPTDDFDAAYAPDGHYVAFTARTVERHLYELPFDTGSGAITGPPRQITKYGKTNYYPQVSADGKMLVWTSHRSGQGNLYSSLISGDDAEKVTSDWSSNVREISGNFDPSGKQVIFASTQGGSYQLWRVPSIGSVGLQLTETRHPQRDVHPVLSPDGSSILFYSNRSGSWDIWRLDIGNNNEQPQQITDWPGNELYPAWSPDGQQIAFVSDRNGNVDIWTKKPGEAEAEPLVMSPAEELWCAWSRDQRWFFFVSNRDGNYNIWKMPAAGGEAEPLTRFNDPAFGLPENGIYTKFAVGPRQLILSLEGRKGDIYVLQK